MPTVPPFITADAEPVPAVNANAARSVTFDATLCREMPRLDGAASGAAASTLLAVFDKYAELAKEPVETPIKICPAVDC